MASGSGSSSGGGFTWTREKTKALETALVKYYGEPDQWEKIAKEVGDGVTIEEVKKAYEDLEEDIKNIESGKIPLPKYSDDDTTSEEESSDEEEDQTEKPKDKAKAKSK